MERKILAAVDGSIHSYNALRYLGQLFTDLDSIAVHLLFVVPSGPVAPGMEWQDENDRMLSLRPEVQTNLRRAKRFMAEAVLQLGRRGISPELVSTSVALSRVGIAHDILGEARKGLYDALLIGRRGLSKIEEFILGSVSHNVAKRGMDLPLWLVDGKVNSRKFLLPVDKSFNSLRAADHLGFILQGNPYAEIELVHFDAILGGDTDPVMDELTALWGNEWCAKYLRSSDSVYAAPEQILLERGVQPGQIRRLREERCVTPHGAIVRQFRHCGTIVIGRRLHAHENLLLKRVSDKVMDMAKEVAVWLV